MEVLVLVFQHVELLIELHLDFEDITLQTLQCFDATLHRL